MATSERVARNVGEALALLRLAMSDAQAAPRALRLAEAATRRARRACAKAEGRR